MAAIMLYTGQQILCVSVVAHHTSNIFRQEGLRGLGPRAVNF